MKHGLRRRQAELIWLYLRVLSAVAIQANTPLLRNKESSLSDKAAMVLTQ